MLKIIRWFVAVFCMAIGGAHAAILQLTPGNELSGALGVSVDGRLYDVQFVDGTCVAVFSGCDSTSDFAFGATSPSSALLAAQALLDEVFVNSVLGPFDNTPLATVGCEAIGGSCSALIPYHPPGFLSSLNAAFANNEQFPGLPDTVGTTGTGANTDLTQDQRAVWAVFTPAQIPEPATLALLGLALAGLGFSRRTRLVS